MIDKDTSGSLTVNPIPSDMYMDLVGVTRHPVPTLKEEERELPFSYMVDIIYGIFIAE